MKNNMKMWESTKMYKKGKIVSTSSSYIDNHDLHMFQLLARFKYIKDAEEFAKIKSKNSKPYEMFSVTKNLSGDPLGEYYVYTVLDIND